MRSPYQQTIDFLYQLRRFGTKLGLENSFRLAALAGNPQERLRFIHLAGTNGKGSTCAMLENIYRRAGLKTGLFTSPHLISFTERIQVGRRPIPETEVTRLAEQLKTLLRHFSSEQHPTFFEVVTVMALLYFVEQQCDLVIWETGLGGRLDSTNIVTPLASVITNIQFDHVRWLGMTLADIAAEKAGIIKPGVPVLTAENDPEPLGVIRRRALELNAPLLRVQAPDLRQPPLDSVRLNLIGQHQKWNAALALATVRALQPIIAVKESHMQAGLESVQWPGRLQVVELPGNRRCILDGAHNPAGAEALRQAWLSNFPGQMPLLILGVLDEKDWPAICRSLLPLSRKVMLAPIHSERTADPQRIADVCRQLAPNLEVTTSESLRAALNQAAAEPLILLTGSLYFVGEALELLQLTPSPQISGERQLNDWGRPTA